MTGVTSLASGTYVLAVSGGVDSVVLLDMLAKQKQLKLVVAHLDHGIRSDSHEDAVFVKKLAQKYSFPFETLRIDLGEAAGEAEARRARYEFLESVRRKYQATAIITAHHADDVIETVIINILRGTGWRGICSLRSHGNYLRPLLHVYKNELLQYAGRHQLQWHEDSTNQSPNYLRNYIRLKLLPHALKERPALKQELHTLWQAQCEMRALIEECVAELFDSIADEVGLRRNTFTKLEPEVADELLRHFLQLQHASQTPPQRARALAFIKMAGNTKRFSLNRQSYLQLTRDHIVVVPVKN